METEIPRDPGAAEYNLGNTLGPAHRHWRRAKFLGRFRLFFRYNSKAAVIIYAWVNDENTLRKAGGGNDPYHLFGGMLRKGSASRRLGGAGERSDRLQTVQAGGARLRLQKRTHSRRFHAGTPYI